MFFYFVFPFLAVCGGAILAAVFYHNMLVRFGLFRGRFHERSGMVALLFTFVFFVSLFIGSDTLHAIASLLMLIANVSNLEYAMFHPAFSKGRKIGWTISFLIVQSIAFIMMLSGFNNLWMIH